MNIGINDDQRQHVADILNKVLADEYVLNTKIKKYHWNVIGPQFHDLHVFFQTLYENYDKNIDAIAERIRALGFVANGTMAEFIDWSELKEEPGHQPVDMVRSLLIDHEAVIRHLRASIDRCEENYDKGSADFLTQLLQQKEKNAWMLRSMVVQ